MLSEEEKIKRIMNMNLSEAFLIEFKNTINYLRNKEYSMVDIMVDNLYSSVKLENINGDEIVFLKNFLISILERGNKNA